MLQIHNVYAKCEGIVKLVKSCILHFKINTVAVADHVNIKTKSGNVETKHSIICEMYFVADNVIQRLHYLVTFQ